MRDGWHILLTNFSSDVTAKELFEIYALRWNIETRFKAWKQSLNLGKVFKGVSNEDHYESLILAALIQQLIGFNLAARLSQLKKVVLSMEKLFEALSAQLSALSQSTLSYPIRLRISHVSIEKRSRQPAHVQWLNLLRGVVRFYSGLFTSLQIQHINQCECQQRCGTLMRFSYESDQFHDNFKHYPKT